jgi:hypothetical protein
VIYNRGLWGGEQKIKNQGMRIGCQKYSV